MVATTSSHRPSHPRLRRAGVVDADIDSGGDIDNTDLGMVSTGAYETARAPGTISATSIDNTVRFSGDLFDAEIGGSGISTVGFRHDDPALGRWLERDPAGFVDSMSLYGYGAGDPVGTMDPSGLVPLDPTALRVCVAGVQWLLGVRGNSRVVNATILAGTSWADGHFELFAPGTLTYSIGYIFGVDTSWNPLQWFRRAVGIESPGDIDYGSPWYV